MSGWGYVLTYKNVKMFSCLYSGKFNVYLRQSIQFSSSGCSENCKPILARNNLAITDKHSAEL